MLTITTLYAIALLLASVSADWMPCAPILPPSLEIIEFVRLGPKQGTWIAMTVPDSCFTKASNGVILGIDKKEIAPYLDTINIWMKNTYALSPQNWTYSCGGSSCGRYLNTRCDFPIGIYPGPYTVPGVYNCTIY